MKRDIIVVLVAVVLSTILNFTMTIFFIAVAVFGPSDTYELRAYDLMIPHIKAFMRDSRGVKVKCTFYVTGKESVKDYDFQDPPKVKIDDIAIMINGDIDVELGPNTVEVAQKEIFGEEHEIEPSIEFVFKEALALAEALGADKVNFSSFVMVKPYFTNDQREGFVEVRIPDKFVVEILDKNLI